MNTELRALIWVVLAGMAVGLTFDVYRAVRRHMRWGTIMTWIGDILFSLFALALLIFFFLKANALDFRFYIFWGSLLGLFLYLGVFSKIVIKTLLQLFRFLSRIWHGLIQILGIPVKFLAWIMHFPYGILRWGSMLLYRMGEAFWGDGVRKAMRGVRVWWAKLFPP